MSPLLLSIILLACLSALAVFFSAAETAFTAINHLKLKKKAEAGDKKSEAIKEIATNPDRLLGVLLFGVTAARITAAGIAGYLFASYAHDQYSEIAGLLGAFLFAVFILIFCTLTPKIIAAAHPEQVSRKLLFPIRIALRLLSPFSKLAGWSARGIVRIMGLDSDTSPFTHGLNENEIKALVSDLNEDEIKAMIVGSNETSVPVDKKQMLYKIFEIGDTQVREIMIPRGDITAINIEEDISDILDLINKTNYSRIPVYRKNFENLIGILFVKDMLQYVQKSEYINLLALLHPVHFVPESARLDVMLRRFQSMHLHMAVVVNEFGEIEGIVTLEDLLEEIVGEIRDEHDTEIESIRKLAPDLYTVAGNLPIREFNRFFDEKIPEAPEYATLAGFLETLTGRLLLAGESVRYQSLILTIEKTERFRVVSIRVRTSTPKQKSEFRSQNSESL